MLQFRRIATLLLGAWLAGSVTVDWGAVQNFQSVERFISDSGVAAAQDLHTLGHDEARLFLRRLVGEQNRFYFEHWEYTELGLGLCLLLVLVFGHRPPKVSILLVLAMLAIVLAQRIALTPQVTRLGRSLELVPANLQTAERKTFWTLHGIYSGIELAKLALGLGVAGLLTIRRSPDRSAFARESELDEVPAGRRPR